MTAPGWLVVVDLQHVFGDEDSPWTAPRFEEIRPRIRRLADAFGGERMLWASDYPWTRDVPGYATLLELAAASLPNASTAELQAIHGGTALRLFSHLRPHQEAHVDHAGRQR